MSSKLPQKRLHDHNTGSNEWSRNNRPFKLLYHEKYHCKKDAEKRENFYKTGIGRKIRDAILLAVSAKG